MKIFLVLHAFPRSGGGGTERTVEALGRAMQAQGHQVTVVAGSLAVAPTSRIDDEEVAGLPVARLHRDDLYFESWWKAYSPGVSSTFARLVRERRPDVVHVHHWLRLSSDLVRLARGLGCKTVVTLHDYSTVLARPVRRIGEDTPAPPPIPTYVSVLEADEAFAFHRRDFQDEVRAADVRLAPSRAHAAGIQALAPGELGAIRATPPPLLQRPARRAPTSPRGRRLVTWGALYPEKGLATVLQALRRAGADWSLTVLGEAPAPDYRRHLESEAKGLSVRFAGAFTTADLEQTPADLAVLPSMCHEWYGLVVDEAQCLGLPMLCADLPAYREHAPAAACAFFVPGDAQSLAALLRDEAALARLQAPPPPSLATAEQAARTLLELYAGIQGGARSVAAPAITDAERAAMLFRRAERRLWTALQQPSPPPPPDDFMVP